MPREPTSREEERHRLHVAACALLLELAQADAEFNEIERSHIEVVVRRHLGLDAETASALIELAEHERRSSPGVEEFASLVRESYDEGQRALLAEIMWGVVSADGRIGRHEGHILGRIASLLELKPGFLSEARRRREGD
jgi:uncharacterized tellurite resistance protein B-like protein